MSVSPYTIAGNGVRNLYSSSSSYIHRHNCPLTISTILKTTPLSFPLNLSYVTAAVTPSSSTRNISKPIENCSSFTWDDVFQVSQSHNGSWDLGGFFQKINLCNRGSENRSDFIPFVIEDQIVGYVHNGFVDHLSKFKDVFTIIKDSTQSRHVTVQPALKTPESRTEALGNLYPVTSSYGGKVYFSLERASSALLWNKVAMSKKDEEKYLWIGKRSETKATYPGMLDHLVAGGLPHGMSCAENVVKGIAIPVGVVSYMDIDGYRFKRDVLFCYDLKLPESFIPHNQDGEVGSFKLLPVTLVADVIRDTDFFKANCNLVIIDFLFRHGWVSSLLFLG
uniref:Putative NUDIX hydrolase domain-like protein n=1 Tax=Helianthus annuus TaxID=4232 RepID=A0A251UNM5_HELAN